jgi:hypothetical protein
MSINCVNYSVLSPVVSGRPGAPLKGMPRRLRAKNNAAHIVSVAAEHIKAIRLSQSNISLHYPRYQPLSLLSENETVKRRTKTPKTQPRMATTNT